MIVALLIDQITQKGTLPRSACAAFTRVDLQLQVFLDPAYDAFKYPLCTALTFHKNHQIVSIAAEAQTTSLQLFIQRVQIQISQQRAQRATLRHARTALLPLAIENHVRSHIRSQVLVQPLVMDVAGNACHESVMADLVKERFNIHINHPVLAADHECFRRPDCIKVAATGPEPITVITETTVP
ncbi:hypothetical protein NZ708_21610 [Pseudomonas syringae pv. actinidiae ICMP 18708]|nr:hypothetical protein IYO_021630 [Pseudomonas syringae pv. actinidiae ICMP 18884]AOE58423.1 hypothetical protein NZ708_21610 [Pseudomonas syringae pv. actinidiae ICMP 18708]APP99378.1 hypothetical protein PsaNZ45_22160 [Pseudomonas syringae pv. actinidiae]APQ05137.1 hypothetical protein PsaNZ47_21600 [Pseudomonas syringae pv. actinidiae]RMP83943.1 hypothetical protein ALQ16_201624 [Pseudomonas syringae pv. actinidiae]